MIASFSLLIISLGVFYASTYMGLSMIVKLSFVMLGFFFSLTMMHGIAYVLRKVRKERSIPK